MKTNRYNNGESRSSSRSLTHRSNGENRYSKVNNGAPETNSTSMLNKRMKLVNNHLSTTKVSKENVPAEKAAQPPSACTLQAVKAFLIEETNSSVDIKKSVEEAEESLVIFQQNSETIRQLVDQVRSTKDDKLPASQLEEIKKNGVLDILAMKNLSRVDKLRLREAKEKLDTFKQRVEKILFSFENIKYQITHLQNEKQICEMFKSRDETLELVDVREFYAFKQIDEMALDSASREEHHKLHMERLNWEIEKRIEWTDRKKELEKKKEFLLTQIESKKKSLAEFEPALHSIIESCKPLTSKLNLPLLVTNNDNLFTAYLQRPLYVLCIELTAFKWAFSSANTDVNILGTPEEVRLYEQELQQKLEQSLKEADDENRKKSKKSKRKTRPSSRFEPIDEPEVKKSKYYECHPMKVQFVYSVEDLKLVIVFSYYPNLEIIGLKYQVLRDDKPIDSNIFNGLFVNLLWIKDEGRHCPNPITYQLMMKDLSYTSQSYLDEIGYSHQWTQKLGGIEFLTTREKPSMSNVSTIRIREENTRKAVNEIASAIQERFESRINFQNEMARIKAKFIEQSKFKAKILFFDQISSEVFTKELEDSSRSEKLFEYFQLDGNDDIELFDTKNFLFKLGFSDWNSIQTEEQEVIFTVFIIVPYDYPRKWPFLTINTNTDCPFIHRWIGQIEKYLNFSLPLSLEETVDDSAMNASMFLKQIGDLQHGIDVLINGRNLLNARENGQLKPEYLGPNIFNIELQSELANGGTDLWRSNRN